MSRKQKVKQIVAGLVLIVCGIVPAIIENDGTKERLKEKLLSAVNKL